MSDHNPELVWWRYADTSRARILVCWFDGEIKCRTTFAVEYDADGASFHYLEGDPTDGSCGTAGDDFEPEVYSYLRGELSALEDGFRKAYYYRPDHPLGWR